MKWSIVTDSSCEYVGENTEGLIFEKVPFVITVGNTDYVDNDSLCVSDMVTAMEENTEISHTACPSPGAWYEKFMKAEQSIAITISSGVSGSYNSAIVARNMILEQFPNKKIYILDSLSAGSALSLFSQKAENLIHDGMDFDAVVEQLEIYKAKTQTVFALSSFGNLVKNGRMNKFAGAIARKLGIWGIGGASDEGQIITKGKARGSHKMMSNIIDDMKAHKFNCGRVIITHCQNLELATKLKESIKEVWSKAHITILSAGGLCSYYAERGGLIVAY